MTTQVGVSWDATMPHYGRWALGVAARGIMSPGASHVMPPSKG